MLNFEWKEVTNRENPRSSYLWIMVPILSKI